MKLLLILTALLMTGCVSYPGSYGTTGATSSAPPPLPPMPQLPRTHGEAMCQANPVHCGYKF